MAHNSTRSSCERPAYYRETKVKTSPSSTESTPAAPDGRRRVLLLCGGRSSEHEVSIRSCLSVYRAIDRSLFSPLVTGIGRDGVWRFYGDTEAFALDGDDPAKVRLAPGGKVCMPGRTAGGAVLLMEDGGTKECFDLAFPVLHGAFGEDGSIQGLFAMLSVPYVGCDFTSSANCMDKELTKLIVAADGFRTARAVTLRRGKSFDSAAIVGKLGLPLFVKPAKTGSSVGISKVKGVGELHAAVNAAFACDDKVLVEECVVGREIECAVLEDAGGSLFVAHPGEVVPHEEFYSYSAKYLNADGATLHVSAELSDGEVSEVRQLAARAFRALGCSGFSRIDFFLTATGFVLNEVNTIPGFTNISLYPQMMASSGIPYAELITRLLRNAEWNYSCREALAQK